MFKKVILTYYFTLEYISKLLYINIRILGGGVFSWNLRSK